MFRKIIATACLLVLTVTMAFAVPTALTVVNLKINNYAVVAGDLNVTPVACDNVNGNSFVATGQEVLVVLNTDTSTHTITVTSVADNYGRLDTSLTTYTVPVAAGGTSGVSAIQMKQQQGWVSGGVINLTCSAATLKYMVLRTN